GAVLVALGVAASLTHLAPALLGRRVGDAGGLLLAGTLLPQRFVLLRVLDGWSVLASGHRQPPWSSVRGSSRRATGKHQEQGRKVIRPRGRAWLTPPSGRGCDRRRRP